MQLCGCFSSTPMLVPLYPLIDPHHVRRSYWIGLYEPVQPPRLEWLLHVDLAPAIGFIMKSFLVGGEHSKSPADPEFSVLTVEHHLVLQAFAFCWDILPFWLFFSIILFVTAGITAYPTFHQNSLYSAFTSFLVCFLVSFTFSVLPQVSMYVTRRSQLSFLESEMAHVETHVGMGPC